MLQLMFYLMWTGQTHCQTYDSYHHENFPSLLLTLIQIFFCVRNILNFYVWINKWAGRSDYRGKKTFSFHYSLNDHPQQSHLSPPLHHDHTSPPLHHDHTSLPLHHIDTSLCPGEGCQQTPQETEPPQSSSRSWFSSLHPLWSIVLIGCSPTFSTPHRRRTVRQPASSSPPSSPSPPKKTRATGLNDYRPVVLTSVVLRAPCSVTSQNHHRHTTGPPAVRLQSQLVFRGCYKHTPLHPPATGVPGNLHQELICGLQLCSFHTVSTPGDSTVNRVEPYRFLGTIISQNLKWEQNISSLIRKPSHAEDVLPAAVKEIQLAKRWWWCTSMLPSPSTSSPPPSPSGALLLPLTGTRADCSASVALLRRWSAAICHPPRICRPQGPCRPLPDTNFLRLSPPSGPKPLRIRTVSSHLQRASLTRPLIPSDTDPSSSPLYLHYIIVKLKSPDNLILRNSISISTVTSHNPGQTCCTTGSIWTVVACFQIVHTVSIFIFTFCWYFIMSFKYF